MKPSQYLNLCLEQAVHSPLRYRHGCVVVKGGKVIGQGYNDYRPGYDGRKTTSSTGKLRSASGASDSDMKHQPEMGFKVKSHTGYRGGSHDSQPLSMHSEMMAINSALTSRSTQGYKIVSRIKPDFKLPSGDRVAGRNEALRCYVDSVCVEVPGKDIQGARSGKAGQRQRGQCQDGARAQGLVWHFESFAGARCGGEEESGFEAEGEEGE
jgi:hypothetical protein